MVKSLTGTPWFSQPLRAVFPPRRAGLGAIVAAGALLAGACGGASITSTTASGSPLAVATIERAIQQSILKQHGISTVVSCPTNAPQQTGYRFNCSAALSVGTYPVTVLELNARGGVSYSNSTPLRVLNSRGVATAIELAIRRERHLKAKVICPAAILQAKGLTFTCTAQTKKGIGPFTVTETDSNGHVRFVGH